MQGLPIIVSDLHNTINGRDPYILSQLRKKMFFCLRIMTFIIGICTFVLLVHYIGTYILFGIVIASSPNHNSVTGCPSGTDSCTNHQKLLCYQQYMTACHILGIVTFMAMLLFLFIICMLFYPIIYLFFLIYNIIIQICHKKNEIIDIQIQIQTVVDTDLDLDTNLSINIELSEDGNNSLSDDLPNDYIF